MKRKSLLLLTFFLSQTTSLWAGGARIDDENEESSSGFSKIHVAVPSAEEVATAQVKRMRDLIEEVIRRTKKSMLTANSAKRTIFIGPSGSGKSTLLNLLAGKPLTADDQGRLDTKEPLLGSEIGHTIKSQTLLPSCHQSNETTSWDCPGWDDSDGSERDVVNAFAIHELFSSGGVKVVLTVEEGYITTRAQNFLKLMNRVTETLPVEQLKRNLVLVITQQGAKRYSDPHKRIAEITDQTPQEGTALLTPKARELIQHLVANKESLIPYFPAPEEEGAYDSEKARTQILQSIDSREYVENPTVRLQIPPESQLLIERLADKLISDVKTSLKLSVELKAPFTFSQWAKGYKERANLESLKEGAEALSKAVSILQEGAAEGIESFIAQLSKFYEPAKLEGLKASMKTLMFLKSIKENINIPTANWAYIIESALKKGQTTIVNLAKSISEAIKHNIEGVVNPKVFEVSSGRIRLDEERSNIESLQEILDGVTRTQDKLRDRTENNLVNLVQPLDRFFDQEASALRQPLESLTFLQSFQNNIVLPREDWAGPLNLPIEQIRQDISMQQQILAAKEEAKRRSEHYHQQALERDRLDQERIERETTARRLTEETERQRLVQEEARRAELISQQQQTERQRLEAEARATQADTQKGAAEAKAREAEAQKQAAERARAAAQEEAKRLAAQKDAAEKQKVIAENAANTAKAEKIATEQKLQAGLERSKRDNQELEKKIRDLTNSLPKPAAPVAHKLAPVPQKPQTPALAPKKATPVAAKQQVPAPKPAAPVAAKPAPAPQKPQVSAPAAKKAGPVAAKQPAPVPKPAVVKKTKIEKLDYIKLKIAGAKNIEEVAVSTKAIYHKGGISGKIISKQRYNTRLKRGKSVSKETQKVKKYYRLDK